MSVFSDETFLPGVVTEIEPDSSYGYDSSKFGSTDSVLVIGTAFDGPSGIPVQVYSPEHAGYVFGKTYDNASKQEATLLPAITDAYQRGCRTLYAMRVTGKPVHKDYEMCVDKKMRLRVGGIYPSNNAKDVFVLFDLTAGSETVKFYKPASRATINEKMQGMVDSDTAVLVTELRLNRDYGLSVDSKLTEVISLINSHTYNNVLKLSIVDDEGSEITTSAEAYDATLGMLFPGLYTIGRDSSLCASITDVGFKAVSDISRPYASCSEAFYRTLNINTDVAAAYPIYAADMSVLKAVLSAVEVTMLTDFDFLEVQGVADRAFAKDAVDYEEVNVPSFELYKRLGKGYAVTARAEKRLNAGGDEITPRVRESGVDDANHIVAIEDGVYSMLENLNAKYRVLVCGAADQEITARIPRPDDFKVSNAASVNVLNDLIVATAKVDSADLTAAKKYSFSFDVTAAGESSDLADVYTAKVIKSIAALATDANFTGNAAIPVGTLGMVVTAGKGALKRKTADGMEALNSAGLVGSLFLVNGKIMKGALNGVNLEFTAETITEGVGAAPDLYQSKEYVLVEANAEVFVMKVVFGSGENVSPIGHAKSFVLSDHDKIMVFATNDFLNTNKVVIRNADFSGFTLSELVDALNENEVLAKLFSFEINSTSADKATEYVSEISGLTFPQVDDLAADRTIGYNYSLYIPYKTTDNFARQLAQHCQYSGMKTTPSHGIIGCERMNDTGLTSIAKKVNKLLKSEFDLYAKMPNGRNMLDKNNMPYAIGKSLSIVLGQTLVSMDDGYRFVSNCAPSYAGMVSCLPLDQSSTNQSIDMPSMMFELTNYQLGKLTQKGIVTFRQSYTKGIVVTDGVTQAPVESVMRRLACVRVFHSVEKLLREACDPYIGKQNTQVNRDSLQTALKSKLDSIKGKLIEAYDFSMIVDPAILKFNILYIDYRIVPLYEIREIHNTITVKDKLD